MIEIADPCSIGPLYCHVGCRGADEGGSSVVAAATKVNTSYFEKIEKIKSLPHPATIAGRKSLSSSTTVPSPSTRVRILQDRISEFQSRGWLSQQEHRNYAALLSSASLQNMSTKGNNNNNNGNRRNSTTQDPHEEKDSVGINNILRELEKELDAMERKFGGDPTTTSTTKSVSAGSVQTIGTKTTKTTTTTTSTTAGGGASTMSRSSMIMPTSYLRTPSAERPRALSVFPQPTSVQASTFSSKNEKMMQTIAKWSQRQQENNNQQQQGKVIMDPEELYTTQNLSDEEIQELFVEMCFFARLGFVQPPCCLQCTYRESMKEAKPNKRCPRWIVWRKDAGELLHPSNLDGNLVVVQCHAARSLLAGKTVMGKYSWDKDMKKLVLTTDV